MSVNRMSAYPRKIEYPLRTEMNVFAVYSSQDRSEVSGRGRGSLGRECSRSKASMG